MTPRSKGSEPETRRVTSQLTVSRWRAGKDLNIHGNRVAGNNPCVLQKLDEHGSGIWICGCPLGFQTPTVDVMSEYSSPISPV